MEANEAPLAKKEDTLRAKHVLHPPNSTNMGADTLPKENVFKEKCTALLEELVDRSRRTDRKMPRSGRSGRAHTPGARGK